MRIAGCTSKASLGACLVLGASLLILDVVFAKEADGILGVWVNGAGDGYIEISRVRDEYVGTIIGGPDRTGAERFDEKNPDPTLRARPLLGLKILTGTEYKGDKWVGGHVYDPNNGKTYKCQLKLLDRDTLSLRGYIGVPLFGRTEIWTRRKSGTS